jgi:catechol 2,3-dioxygenase-like lactoylglutathione lyase family enzyme
MIGYVTLGTNNLEKAVAFYDDLFGSIDVGRFMEEPGKFVAWAPTANAPSVAVTAPFDGKNATVGNGVMVALILSTPAEVDALYSKALALGGSSEGAPGPRGAAGTGFSAGYFRDLDGNKLNAFCVETP